MVMVKDPTQLTLDDLWKEVKDEEDWWGDINERVLGMVKLILEGSLEAELLEELQVSRYKRSSSKRGYRNGHYQRKQVTHPGEPGHCKPGPKAPEEGNSRQNPRILRDNFLNRHFRGPSHG